MNTKNLFCAAAIMLGTVFTACTSDISDIKQDDKPAIDDGAKIYMSIDISSLSGGKTRSTTKPEDQGGGSSDGTEDGQESENKISNIMVLLVGQDANNKDACFIAKWYKDYSTAFTINNGATLTAEFNRSALLDHIQEHSNRTNIKVYVICNYDEVIDQKIGSAGKGVTSFPWLTMDNAADGDKVTVGDAVIPIDNFENKEKVPYWQPNKFLMTNAESYSADIKSLMDELSKPESKRYSTPEDAFVLAGTQDPILVERAVARFDYKAAAKDDDKIKEDASGLYYSIKEKNSTTEILKIRLQRMALVNMSKHFYLFRRVSDDGKGLSDPNTNNFAISGVEHGKTSGENPKEANFVVDPEWNFKTNCFTATTTDEAYKNRFRYWFFDRVISNTGIIQTTSWDNYEISDVLKNSKYDGEYSFWRYVTPNTIPGTNLQRNGITTGIVFKAKIEASDASSKVGIAMAANKDVFAFNGEIIGSWQDVQNAAKDNSATSNAELKNAFERACTKEPSLKETTESKFSEVTEAGMAEKMIDAAVKDGGFARFTYVEGSKDTEGYFCYYYYWNRHNDNANPNQMGPMEFGVVRNNIYKICVTSINRIGHPFRPGNDPDDPKPDTPDEVSKLYMTVSVKVKPWTKRVNNADF